MAKKAAKSLAFKVVSENRKARFSYAIGETWEAGIALTGTEVKSLRAGRASLADAYASPKGNEIYLINAHIPEYAQGNRYNHEPKRPRKLLLHRREIGKLSGAVERAGMTLVPLRIYFNEQGRAKVEVGLGKGKKAHDKRDAAADRDWSRNQARIMKHGARD
jgi:SsrA-binding protein